MEKVIVIKDVFVVIDFLSSRHNGEILRKMIVKELNDGNKVALDFKGIVFGMSHSFADEAFGLLSLEIGLDTLKEKVRLINVNESIMSQANFVIKDRNKL